MHTYPPVPIVAILMSTYNGHRFLAQQLDSLLEQDYPSILINVRDDGSTDSTLEVLRTYSQRDRRISVTVGRNIGCVRSFLDLLRAAKADIMMFCDQDDVWLPTKVSSAVCGLVAAGLQKPILYHTDLVVVDEQLNIMEKSFMTQQGVKLPAAHTLEVLAIQNCVVGCTVAMTAKFARDAILTNKIVGEAAMHDWWLAMVACCQGGLIYSPKAEILYRQHDANVSGAMRRSSLEQIRLQLSSVGLARINDYRRKVSRQAQEFLANYGEELNFAQRSVLAKVADLDPVQGLLPVLRTQLCGIRFQNIYMNLALTYTAIITRAAGLFGSRLG